MSQTEVQLIKDSTIVNADISNSAAIDVSKVTGAMPLAGGSFTNDVTFTGDSANIVFDKSDNALEFADNAKATFGTGADITIKHDGSNSEIINTTGSLLIDGQNALTLRSAGNIIGQVNDSETTFQGIANGAFEAYFDNSKKLETTNLGVTVTGNVTSDELKLGNTEVVRWGSSDTAYIQGQDGASGYLKFGVNDVQMTVNRNGTINLPDNNKITFGDGSDLQIYSNGTAGYIDHVTTGTGADLILRSKTFVVRNLNNETMIVGNQNGAVNLYYDNVKKFETGTNYSVVTAISNGNPAGLKVTNSDANSNYSHAELRLISKNGASYGVVFNDHANSNLRLGHNTTGNTLEVYNDGSIRSQGTRFGSDTAAANTLDDYEEGTWTPALSNGTGITVHNAAYTKVGRKVTIYAYVTINSNQSSGGLVFTGLPFNEGNHGYALGTAYTQTTGSIHVFNQVAKNGGYSEVLKNAGNTILQSDVSGAYVLFANTYFTT